MTPTKVLPEKLQILATEIATYYRELPRLLAAGEEGRFVVVKGDRVVSVWDTSEDSYQAGVEAFGLQPFLSQPIDARDIARLAPYMPPLANGVSA